MLMSVLGWLLGWFMCRAVADLPWIAAYLLYGLCRLWWKQDWEDVVIGDILRRHEENKFMDVLTQLAEVAERSTR